MKKIAIIGAGPGGLAAAMLLSKKGFKVDVYDKNATVGGRSRAMEIGEYRFDIGPTFLMYIDILKEVFKQSGFDLEKEVDLIRLDPLYKLVFHEQTLTIRKDVLDNVATYESIKKGLGDAYLKWHDTQKDKLKRIAPILRKPFTSKLNYLRPEVLKALPVLHPFQSVYKNLSTYDKDETFIHSLSFQAKYLGMASYEAPSIFTFLPFLEHELGLFHVKGGISKIHEKMKELSENNGATFYMQTAIKRVLVKKGRAYGIKRADDQEILYDEIVINADFAYAMHELIYSSDLKKYHPYKVQQKKYSVSTFMIYLGLDQTYSFEHHGVYFSKDYATYLKKLMRNEYSEDFSYYLHNPSVIDETLAPKGHSSLYILVPVPNLSGTTDWVVIKHALKDAIINDIEERHQVNLRDHIKVEKIIHPKDWQQQEHVYLGAVFSLAHGLNQMLDKRPHNQFEDIKGIYLVGGGTHPGSGLPTIYQSALITNQLIKP